MQPLYEDNHVIVVYKEVGEIVQGDKTGDLPLCYTVKEWLKEKYQKPGNVFLGVVHRLDRPVAGLVVFAKTSKALSRLNDLFRKGEVHKTYWAIVQHEPAEAEGLLTNWLVRNERQNKTYAYDHEVAGSKKAMLRYKVIGRSDRYVLLEIHLLTGRHHQIRTQLAHIGCPIKGDLKYGAPRSNPDGGISLLSHRVAFVHPVSKQPIDAMNLGMGLLPDDRKAEGIIGDLSVRENIILALQAKRGIFKLLPMSKQIEIADKYIELLQIKTANRETLIKQLSGGNQQKVILARWLATDPEFLILDEPTRGIDVGTKTEIQKLVIQLAEEGKSLIFISSEIEEMLRTCSKLVVLRDGEKVGEITDNLTQEHVMQAIAGGGTNE